MFETILHYTIIALEVIFAFGLVILFHEFGHFVVAKLNGVAAPEFALGMGPEITGFNWRGTRYKLCLFPIGGYVRMVGEEDDDELDSTFPAEQNFRNKNAFQKIAIIFAGPFMNYVLAVGLFAFVFMAWGVPRESLLLPDEQSQRVVISFADVTKPAYHGGIRDNDTILSANGVEITDFESFQKIVQENADKPVEIVVKRPGGTEKLTVTPKLDKMKKQGQIGVLLGHPEPRKVESIEKGSPAAAAGLKKGDIILDFDKTSFFEDTQYEMPAEKIELLVRREGATEPETIAVAGTAGAPLGVNLQPLNVRLGFFTAIAMGHSHCVSIVDLTLGYMKDMIKRKVSTDEVSGPVGIVRYAADFAKKGMKDFIHFFGVISISLGIINLFPIPALDGSRIVFHLWEAIIRRPLDPKREALVHYVGFCLLMGLLLIITFRDVRKIFGF